MLKETPMAQPLRSEDSNVQSQNIQFSHFGVLQSGNQSKSSVATAVIANLILLAIAIIIGAAAKVTMQKNKQIATLVVPIAKAPEPPKPPKIVVKLPPPPKLKPMEPKVVLPEVKIEPPKIEPPKVETPPVKVERPQPPVTPAPPKQVVAAAAPKPTTVNLGQSASVINNNPHPSAVALGQTNNPIAPSNRPATASVDLGQRGMSGMPASNTGGGPASTRVSLGSGQPNGALAGGGARAVAGVKLGGITGGTGNTPGNGIGNRPANVQLGQATPPPQIRAVASSAPAHSAPQVVYKPRPVYTAEATAKHLEGVVSVKIHVSPNGAIRILGITNGLGSGLDQSAESAVMGMRFKPATDPQGNPTDWEGVVNITFQMAGA